jgi:hypothetical protein
MKIVLREIGEVGMNWVHLGLDFLETVMNLRVS